MSNSEPKWFEKQATATQVRAYYVKQGFDVRITMAGQVSFRKSEHEGPWLDGRWVSDYWVDRERGVYLT